MILQASSIYLLHPLLEAMSSADGRFDWTSDPQNSTAHEDQPTDGERGGHGQEKQATLIQPKELTRTANCGSRKWVRYKVCPRPQGSSKPTNAPSTRITTTSRRDHECLWKRLEPLPRAVGLERDKSTSFEHACARGLARAGAWREETGRCGF
jgi:hypothetical protein